MPTYVWVIQSGYWEDRWINGVYSSLEKAIESIKSYPELRLSLNWRGPRTVDEVNYTFYGDFPFMPGCPDRDPMKWDITKYELDEKV